MYPQVSESFQAVCIVEPQTRYNLEGYNRGDIYKVEKCFGPLSRFKMVGAHLATRPDNIKTELVNYYRVYSPDFPDDFDVIRSHVFKKFFRPAP